VVTKIRSKGDSRNRKIQPPYPQIGNINTFPSNFHLMLNMCGSLFCRSYASVVSE
jgi:hypothetical protein